MKSPYGYLHLQYMRCWEACYDKTMTNLYLTCPNDQEALTISKALLEAKAAVCIRRAPVESIYWWEGTIEEAHEVQLIIESRQDKFDAIEAIVTKHHSSQNYVLTAIPVLRTTPGVVRLLDENLE